MHVLVFFLSYIKLNGRTTFELDRHVPRKGKKEIKLSMHLSLVCEDYGKVVV
jgi:hypothetical protein